MTLREIFRRGDPAIWFAGTGLGISLLMIAGMIGLILTNGLGFFWPKPLVRLTLTDGTSLLGELAAREAIPQSGSPTTQGPSNPAETRESGLVERRLPVDRRVRHQGPKPAAGGRLSRAPRVWSVHRRAGTLERWREGARQRCRRGVASAAAAHRESCGRSRSHSPDRTRRDWHHQRSRSRQSVWRCVRRSCAPAAKARCRSQRRARRWSSGWPRSTRSYAQAEARLGEVLAQTSTTRVTLAAVDGTEKELPTIDIFRAYRANELSLGGRAAVYAQPPLGVSVGRPARIEHRGWNFSRDLRHRHDGRPHEHARGAVRRARGALSEGICPAGSDGAHRSHRRQQPRGRALDRLWRIRSRFLRLLHRRLDRPGVLSRAAADADVRHRRYSVGLADARSPDGPDRDRRLGGGAGGGSPRHAGSVARHRGHQVPDHPARRAARGGAGHPDRA